MLQPSQGSRAGYAFRPPSDVGTYEYPKGVDLRPHLDDFFDIYGPSSLRSANHPQEDFTYVHTFGKAERQRARKNLVKTGGPVIPGYKIKDPLVLAAEEAVLYPTGEGHHTGEAHYGFHEAGLPHHRGYAHHGSQPRSGLSCSYGVAGPTLAKESTVPAPSHVHSLNYRIPPGLNPMYLPPPPVPTKTTKFSNKSLTAVDPRAQVAAAVPSSQVDVSPLWTKPVNFATEGHFAAEGQRYAQVSPDSGCSGGSALLSAEAPTMTVQGEFASFDTPPKVVQPIHNPFLRNTAIGAYGGPEPGVFVPYRKATALPSCGGGFTSLEGYLQQPWTTGVEGLGL